MAESGGGNRAAEFWVRDLAFAGDPERGAAVSDRATVVAQGGSDEAEIGEESAFYHIKDIVKHEMGYRPISSAGMPAYVNAPCSNAHGPLST